MTPPVAPPSPPRPAAAAAAGLAALSLAAGVALLIALAGLDLLAAEVRPTEALAMLWRSREAPEVRRWVTLGAIGGAGAGAALLARFVAGLRPPLFGATRWAGEAEIRRCGLRARSGIVLGRANGAPLVFGGEEHVLLQAPTRSGKGVGVVIPNLLAWPDSVVVLDVKGENWAATAGFRQSRGQAVYLFDPLDAEGRTARYNPLGHVNRDDPVAVVDELQRIAAMLFPHPPAADPFWSDSARTAFVGVGAYLAETPELPFSLGALYREITHGDPKARFPASIARRKAEGRPLSPACVQALTDFCASSENTFASIRQTLTSRLNLWLNPRVCAATAGSDFDLRDLRRRRMSLYLATSPDNLVRVAPLYNLLFQQLIDLSCRHRPHPATEPHQVLVLLDEFARLGHAGVLARAFAYVAGYGLRLLPVLQSAAQLRSEYGPDLAEEIVANCAVELVFAPKDRRLAHELSDRLGANTVRSTTRSRPAGFGRGPSGVSESSQRRPLLLPQEVMRLPDHQMLVLKAGMSPLRARKIVYWREAAFRARLRPPPQVPPLAASVEDRAPGAAPERDDLTLEAIADRLAAAGAEPLPPPEGGDGALEAWIRRFIDRSAAPGASP